MSAARDCFQIDAFDHERVRDADARKRKGFSRAVAFGRFEVAGEPGAKFGLVFRRKVHGFGVNRRHLRGEFADPVGSMTCSG